MFSKPALAALLLANAIPLAGVLYFDWDALLLILGYWFENLVIGFYAGWRIALASTAKGMGAEAAASALTKIFIVPFFFFHFGAFCGAHGFFILAFSGLDGLDIREIMQSRNWPGPLVFLGMLANVVEAVWMQRPRGIELLLGGLFVSHGVSFLAYYVLGGERLRTTPAAEMSAPYGRIVLLHVAIIAAGVPVMMAGSPLPLLILLVLGKTALDIKMHMRSHRKRQRNIIPEQIAHANNSPPLCR